jgi:hypothetical protein
VEVKGGVAAIKAISPIYTDLKAFKVRTARHC